MNHLYFAYGSNLSVARMTGRVASARFVAPARLLEWRLTCDKRGRDGSGKANIVPARDAEVWGALYRIDLEHWEILDGFERGYERMTLQVWTHDRSVEIQTYASQELTDDPTPFDWYKQLLVQGAWEHGLPAHYVERLVALPARPDPSRARRPT